MRRLAATTAIAFGLAGFWSPSLLGATQSTIGAAGGDLGCIANLDTVQVDSGSPSYVVPPGLWFVTSWSTLAGGTGAGPLAGSLQLELWRPTAIASTFSLVGISPVVTTTASGLNTFGLASPIEVQGGDILGLRTMTEGYGCARLAEGFVWGASISTNPPVIGEQRQTGFVAGALNVSATLQAVEPVPITSVPTTTTPAQTPASPRFTG
jgi:hypothetical protein